MSDIKCPFCGHEQDICHDDGFGYEEDVAHEEYCNACGKHFVFYTSVTFNYEAQCGEEDDACDFDDEGTKNFPDHRQCKRCENTIFIRYRPGHPEYERYKHLEEQP